MDPLAASFLMTSNAVISAAFTALRRMPVLRATSSISFLGGAVIMLESPSRLIVRAPVVPRRAVCPDCSAETHHRALPWRPLGAATHTGPDRVQIEGERSQIC